MKIDLEKIRIIAPTNPTQAWKLNDRNWEEYRIEGFLDEILLGHITICRGLNIAKRDNDRFFLDLSKNPPIPKPYVCYQDTREEFRGQGVCKRILFLANEFYRGKLGTTLYSDTLFIRQYEKASKGVWKDFEKQGLAVFEPYVLNSGEKKDRWFMI